MIDEASLRTALPEGRLVGVAHAVFSQEPVSDTAVLQPLLSDPRVIATLHPGVSPIEAQVLVATEVAHRIVSVRLRDRLYTTMWSNT